MLDQSREDLVAKLVNLLAATSANLEDVTRRLEKSERQRFEAEQEKVRCGSN